ncbi:MAG: T9SS type A sorting domain-containing protein [Bacteroidales bacterium]|nr:T9SS type A sorting domain-containing protein [Bacteroidales bacterium]
MSLILIFSVTNSYAQITNAEYFWDIDPGNGNGNTILALDGNFDEAIETIFSSGVNQPAVGVHTFNVRVKDANNFWGPVFTMVVNIESSVLSTNKKIIQAEYFWDADPGNGNGTTILALDGNFDQAIETVFSSGVNQPAAGLHTFNIRVKDFGNFWGPTFTRVVSVENAIIATDKKIIQAEYFWDTDPGNGNGTTILALDGNFDEAIETVFSNAASQPAVGLHTFNIRVKDFGNFWGPTFTRVINIESIIVATDKKIIQAEYFWDTDPGAGNGTTILAIDGNFDQAIETVFSNAASQPAVGLHTFNIRVKDFGNFWGPTFTRVVHIENTIVASDKKVIQAECFWDTDPGEGNGYTILALDGNLDEAIETLTSSNVPTLGLSLGAHVFNIRIKDQNNFWGPLFKHVVEVTDCIAPLVDLGIDKTICDGENISIDASNHFESYLWSTGATTQIINVTLPGTYFVAATDTLGCIRRDTIVILPQQYVHLGNDTTICSMSNLVINAGSFQSYLWSNTQTSQSINISTSTTSNYSVTVTDVNGCISTDAIQISVFALPDINLGNDTAMCVGSTLTLDAGTFASYLWTGGSTAQNLVVTNTNTYSVTVTDNNSCSNSDYIVVTFHALPIVNLGTDQVICDNNPITLNAGAFSSYLWSDMSTNQTLIVNAAGIYSLEVTNIYGCTASDTIHVSESSTVTSAYSHSICEGDSYLFNGNYLTTGGIYFQTLSSAAGCDSIVELTLSVLPLPVIFLGNDTTLCEGENIVLDAGIFATYLWTGGSTAQNLVVTNSNTYSVTVTDNNSCSNTDQIVVTFNSLPVPDLGPDQVVCENNPITLNAGIFSSYLWSDMSTNQTLIVNATGIYFVEVTNSYGCSGSDTIHVSESSTVTSAYSHSICEGDSYFFNGNNITTGGIYLETLVSAAGCDSIVELTLSVIPLPIIFLGNDTTLCQTENIILDAGTHDSYIWTTGGENQQLSINYADFGLGTHTIGVTVTDNGCNATDQIDIIFVFCVGIDESDGSNFVYLYPNPNYGTVFIQLNNIQSAQKVELKLFNPAGQLIQTWDRTITPGVPESINFENAVTGIYYLQVSSGQKTSFHKLICN